MTSGEYKMSGWRGWRGVVADVRRKELEGRQVPAVGQTNINRVPTHLPNSALQRSIFIICDFSRQKPNFSAGTS